MTAPIRCPKCAAEVSDPTQPCPKCGFIIEHPQRKRYQRQVIVSGATMLTGYALGMLGTVIQVDAIGITGLLIGFVGAVWLMWSMYLLFRTGV